MASPIRRLAAGLVAAALVAAFAACSPSASGGSAGPVATSTVDLPPSYRFDPAAITVARGTTVTWTNRDNFTHSVEFTDGGLPTDPQVMKPGATANFKFTSPGTYHYICSFHPQDMKGTVVVQP